MKKTTARKNKPISLHMSELREKYGITQSQGEALRWFHSQGGDGVFMKKKDGRLMARGMCPAFELSTWEALAEAKLTYYYMDGVRMGITPRGLDFMVAYDRIAIFSSRTSLKSPTQLSAKRIKEMNYDDI